MDDIAVHEKFNWLTLARQCILRFSFSSVKATLIVLLQG